MKEVKHWADQVADQVIKDKGKKKIYVCAAGITPSGTVHIGNFREIITVDLIVRALKDKKKNVSFIYSWDDYDVFRKIPIDMPNQSMLKKHLRMPIVDVPDPYNKEKSYARYNEVQVEKNVAKLGIKPNYLYQAKKYRNLDYVKGIKTALQNREKLREILNQFRTEPLPDKWLPISGYCPSCNKYNTDFSGYDGEFKLEMKCHECKKVHDVDIRKAKFLKLPWRVDWPMRWSYEKVDFEPGGKDHSTPGGSYSTGKEVVQIYDWTAPNYQVYNFIRIKGMGGKISSSLGNVVTLGDCLEIYTPEIIRWLFAGTRPNAEFAISFDLDVIKIYEDFDKVERIYYGNQKVSGKEEQKQKRIYELSSVDKPAKKMPFQAGFRHLTNVLLTHSMDINKTIDYFKLKNKSDKDKLKVRANCAKNWIEKYAPDDFKYTVQSKFTGKLNKEYKKALKDIANELKKRDFNDKELHSYFYEIIKKHNLEPKDFFMSAYKVLIDKNRGPQLASFILIIGRDKVAKLFDRL